MKPLINRKSMLLRFCVALALTAGGFSPNLAAAPHGMNALDMVELSRVSDPALSPDGTRVVYLRTEVDWSENKEVKRLHISSPHTGMAIGIVEPAEPQESFDEAVWLPTGKGLLTALKRDEDDIEQVYVYDLETEIITRLTQHPGKVEDFSTIPEADDFYFRAEVARPKTEIGESKGSWTIDEYESNPQRELWFYDWSSGDTKRVLGGEFDVRSYEVSRDGSKVLYVRAATALLDEQDRELWVYDIESEGSERITTNSFVETGAVLSPDNTRVAYIATVDQRGRPYYEDNIFVQQVGSEDRTLILPRTAMEMLDVDWDAAGTGLYILGNTGVRTHLYHLDLQTSQLQNLTPGDHVIGEWTYHAVLDTHVYRKQSASTPGDVWTLASGEAKGRQMTHEHTNIAERFVLPRQTVFTWRGRGSVTLEGLLVYPLDYQPGEKAPLVSISHGGPRSSSQFGSWNMSRYVPVLAAQGYVVFLPNYRGGTGYGDAFMRDMVGDYFRNAHHDVLDGIDALIDAGIADPDQLIKMGWSAGGHMTNKLITVTDRFRAASSGAGVSDWVSLYGESDVRHNRGPWFGGAPWTERAPLKNYLRQSLLKDAWRITIPTLFWVGDKDVRVPPTQTIMMYRAAKAAGVETELYVAPEEKHQYAAPSHRLFKVNKELDWYAKHLGRPAYEPVYPAAKDALAE